MTGPGSAATPRARDGLAPDDPRHGTINGYNNHGCRCDACRRAATAHNTAYRHRTGRNKPLAEHLAERRAEAETRDNHGTESRYRLGCRCDECRAATAAARARRRKTPNVAVHNAVAYSNGCRCDICRTARNERERKRRAAA